VWKLAQSPKVEEIFVAPGNAGTAATAHNLDIKPTDIQSLAQFAIANNIDLTVVGPEAPLAAGIVDNFRVRGLPIFGATQAAAQIETSKVFSKDLMQKYDIPCAHSVSFSNYEEARAYVRQHSAPLVVKADGLAAGKGVIVADEIQHAEEALSSIMRTKDFGSAGDKVIIEEKLTGREMSIFAFTDGEALVPIVAACDYKPAFDGNQGPNTGGMGSYSPPYFLTPDLAEEVTETIMKPTIKAMLNEGMRYTGILYGGLMITENGPKALEFNARFGDPECQIILPRLKTDLVDVLLAVVEKQLDQIEVEWSDDACVGVVMASGGYPGNYQTSLPITGLDKVDKDITVFHAGTKTGSKPGEVLTSGGRVLTVVATGKSLTEARERVYANIPKIHFENCHYRTDIALINK